MRRYAVARGLKVEVHDLMVEALEEWGAKRGLVGLARRADEIAPVSASSCISVRLSYDAMAIA